MKIAIIGAGKVGTTLGEQWKGLGYDIYYGVRNPSDLKYNDLRTYAVVSFILKAVETANIVVLAVHWNSAKEVVETIQDALADKILIDCTNPVAPDLSGVAIGHTTSAAEQIQAWAPGCVVVKAFNQIGFNIMADPVLDGRKSILFIASDSEPACQTVEKLATDIGFEVVIMKSLRDARLLEPFAMLWISMAYKLGYGREFAFSLIKRD